MRAKNHLVLRQRDIIHFEMIGFAFEIDLSLNSNGLGTIIEAIDDGQPDSLQLKLIVHSLFKAIVNNSLIQKI
jgi:hypothetical protein